MHLIPLSYLYLTNAVFRIRIRIRIRIHQIHVFLGLFDPDPDPLVRGMDLDPAPEKTLISTVLWLLFDYLPLKKYVKVPSNEGQLWK